MVSSQTSGQLDNRNTSDDSTSIVQGLSIEANAMEGSDTIEITGHTSKTNVDVTFTVTSPNGN